MAATQIEYEKIPTTVTNMNDASKEMGQNIKEAYDIVRDMQNHTWHGTRYRDFTVFFNGFIEEPFLRIMTYLVVTIPEWMRDWDMKIANFENRAPRSIPVEKVILVEPIVNQDKPGLFIDPVRVETGKEDVIKCLENVVSILPRYIASVNDLNWEGPTASAFNDTMIESKAKLEETIKEIQTTFNKEVQATLEDRTTLESGNI